MSVVVSAATAPPGDARNGPTGPFGAVMNARRSNATLYGALPDPPFSPVPRTDMSTPSPVSPTPSPEWDGVRELPPAALASRLQAGDPITVIDVREEWEWTTVRVECAQHIPLGSFATAAASLDPEAEIVLLCHHGMRSLAAANHLVQRGFRRVWNLSGGIDRFAAEIDPSMPRY